MEEAAAASSQPSVLAWCAPEKKKKQRLGEKMIHDEAEEKSCSTMWQRREPDGKHALVKTIQQ